MLATTPKTTSYPATTPDSSQLHQDILCCSLNEVFPLAQPREHGERFSPLIVSQRRNRLVGCLALAYDNLAPLPDPPLGVELFGSAALFTDTEVFAIKYPVVCFVLTFVEAVWPGFCIHFLFSI